MPPTTQSLLAAPGPLARGADLEQLLKASNKTLADVDVLLFSPGAEAPATSTSIGYEHAVLCLSDSDALLPGAVAKLLRPGSTVTVHPGALTAVRLCVCVCVCVCVCFGARPPPTATARRRMHMLNPNLHKPHATHIPAGGRAGRADARRLCRLPAAGRRAGAAGASSSTA